MKSVILFLLMLLSLPVIAQDSRWVDLEWEAVPLAKEYEVELFQEEGQKTFSRGKYKVDSSQWSHAVPAGKYFLRLRSIDQRGVPGEWSPHIPLKVRMSNPIQLRPSPGEKLSDPLVTFDWAPVAGAANYQLVIRNRKNEILHNAVSPEVKSTVYLEKLGETSWAVYALEKGEDPRPTDDLPEAHFKHFVRTGGVLDAPHLGLAVSEKVVVTWNRVRGAQAYQVDYFPPAGSGDKNRRYNLKLTSFGIPVANFKEGVTTITVKATAQGHQDSVKSIAKLSKSGDSVEVEDIVQGKEPEEKKSAPTKSFFRNELFIGLSVARFSYQSDNIVSDTRLGQDNLTGLGFQGEWKHRPSLNALSRLLEVSILNLSSGVESGLDNRLAYSWIKEKKFPSQVLNFGAGLSYLSLPAFLGNRFNKDVKVESTSSLGPELHLSVRSPFSDSWESLVGVSLAYHPLLLGSNLEGLNSFLWMKGYGRLQKYFTEKEAFYGQLDYQSWSQEWKDGSSSLSGTSISFGVKTGF